MGENSQRLKSMTSSKCKGQSGKKCTGNKKKKQNMKSSSRIPKLLKKDIQREKIRVSPTEGQLKR